MPLFRVSFVSEIDLLIEANDLQSAQLACDSAAQDGGRNHEIFFDGADYEAHVHSFSHDGDPEMGALDGKLLEIEDYYQKVKTE